MKRPPLYRDSQVEWIGQIPENWEMRKVSRSFDLIGSGTTPKSDNTDYYKNGTVRWVITGDLNDGILKTSTKRITEKALDDYPTLRLYPPGTLLIAMYGATIGKICLLDFEACTNQACCAISESPYFLNKFVFYWFKANKQNIIRLGYGGGQPNISQDIIRFLKIPSPPVAEQKQIAEYLDRRTKQIDTLIEKKQKLIELLKEQRTAIINQAVTKGLDPNVPMKDSGIEWLGEIPEHWNLRKIKSELEFLDHQRVPLSAEVRGMMTERKYDYYGASGIIDKVDDYIFDETLILLGEDGANLLSRSTPLAFVAKGKYWVNNHAHILRPQNGDIDYFVNLLEALDYTTYVSGSAQPKLTSDNLKNIVIPIPTKYEQNEIAKFIKLRTVQIDTMAKKHNKSIELLNEYRTALVSEAVTGKIDVRGEKV